MIVVDDPDFTLHNGDALTMLRTLPDESVHCCLTSPPYWGLRDYGTGRWDGGDPQCDHTGPPKASERSGLKNDGRPIERVGQNDYERAATVPFRDVCGKCGARRADNQLGLEPTPEEYVTNMVAVFREVRRVLRADGTCWINLGDSYASSPPGNTNSGVEKWATSGLHGAASEKYAATLDASVAKKMNTAAGGLKPKDLVGIPWRVAFALQADGWYLRSDIIWAKPNPMPESVTDRPTKAHEYVFLLSKSPRYFFDQDAVREPAEWARWGDQTNGKHEGSGSAAGWIKPRSKRSLTWPERKALGEPIRKGLDGNKHTPSVAELGQGRNIRSVWEIATQPYPEAHFATFPEALVDRIIRAGTSERGVCPECGAPWVRESETTRASENGRRSHGLGPGTTEIPRPGGGNPVIGVTTLHHTVERQTLDWNPSCDHGQQPVPATILDPFMGSGTTALVARNLGRRSIGVDLNPDYCEMAARRLQQLSLLA